MRELRIDELSSFMKYVVDGCEAPYNQIRSDLMSKLFENLIGSGHGTVYGEEVGGEPAGFLSVMWMQDPITGDNVALSQLWLVKPEYRGGPIAGRLFDVMDTDARARGCQRIMAGCILDRERLGKQYLRHGFELYSMTYNKVL